jgi:glycosyltransferase involved in cell wall biosynthesis
MIPQPNNEYINTTIPHKLFEYMHVGRPIIVSDALPLKRIITETNAGIFFISDNTEDFAGKIILLKESKIPYGENGKKAVEEKYNWSVESEKLKQIYHVLVNRTA